MRESPVVAVVCGGPSAEAEVSRVSGRCVAEALRATYSNVSLLELEEFVEGGFGAQFSDVVFPAFHGPPGEDGTFQGFLEVIGLPYVGCDVPSSACAMDKVVAKQLFRSRDLPVADDVVVYQREGAEAGAQRVVDALGQDVVIKPSSQGSALGVVFGRDVDDLAPAIEQAFAFDDRVLIERRIEGKEITVAILERDGDPKALPVVEITTPAGSWYDYEHRYTPGLSEHIMPARAAFAPDFLFISAGFDAHVRDPLAQITLETDDYDWVTRELLSVADECCAGKVVSLLEGGYNLDALRESVQAHVRVLMAD